MQTQMNLTTTTPKQAGIMPFSIWEMYIQTMNFPIRETEIDISFYFRTYPKQGVIDMNPFFLIQGSFNNHIVEHIQRRTGKHFPKLGESVFEAITVNGQTFVCVNRHLLMDAIMEKKITNIGEHYKNVFFKFAQSLFFLNGGHKQCQLNDQQQFEVIGQLSKYLESRITKSLDV